MAGTESIGSVFRRRFREARNPLVGSFVKSPGAHAVEILAGAGFDFVVVDEEHAPLDRLSTEISILAARASQVASIVRVPNLAPERILAALDDGASGILVPHISSAKQAEELVSCARYSGKRGFSNSPRAGAYGQRAIWEHVDQSDREVTVIAMIEDAGAVSNIQSIVDVEGLDGIFIGRGDLCVALNDREPDAPLVKDATLRVIEAATTAHLPVCLLAANAAEVAEYMSLGVSAFLISSDQGFMRTAATEAVRGFRALGRQGQAAEGK